MPRLPTYSAKLDGGVVSGGRRASAEDTGAVDLTGAVRAVQAAGEGFLQEAEQEQTRQAIVENQRIRAQAIADLRAAEMEGRDTAPILEKLDEEIARVGEGFTTKRGAQAAEYHGQSSRAVVTEAAAVMNARRSGRQLANQARTFDAAAAQQLQIDPTALGRILAEREALMGTYSGKVPPELIAAARQEGEAVLTAASVQSVIEADPALAERLLRDVDHKPWGALTPQQRASLVNTAQSAQTANANKKLAEERERKLAMQAAGDAAMNEMLQMQADGKLAQFDTNALLRRTDVDPDRRLQILNVHKALVKDMTQGPAKERPEVFNSLRERIDLPQDDPRKLRDVGEIWNVYAKGQGLSKEGASFLERRMRDNRSESGQKWATAEAEAIRNLKGQLDKSTMLSIDAAGGERVQSFTVHLRERKAQFEKEGKDPYSLLNPKSKDYIGNDIPLFQSGAQRTQADLTRQIDRSLAPKTPATRRSLDDIFKGTAK